MHVPQGETEFEKATIKQLSSCCVSENWTYTVADSTQIGHTFFMSSIQGFHYIDLEMKVENTVNFDNRCQIVTTWFGITICIRQEYKGVHDKK